MFLCLKVHYWRFYCILLLLSLQISAGASNPRLSDTIEYPTLLRTVSSDAAVVDGIIAMMKHYGWSRIACVTQQEFIFTAVCIMFKACFFTAFPQIILCKHWSCLSIIDIF